MAAAAEPGEIFRPIVAGDVVQMRGAALDDDGGNHRQATTPYPALPLSRSVLSAALLAAIAGAFADRGAGGLPFGGAVVVAEFRTDRHLVPPQSSAIELCATRGGCAWPRGRTSRRSAIILRRA